MSFFKSEVVQENLQEIFQTYQEISSSQYWLPRMSQEERVAHIERTKELIDKQKLFYFRLTLAANDGDKEAAEMKDRIQQLVQTFGYKDLPHCLESLLETLERALGGA